MNRKEFLQQNKNIISKLYNGVSKIYGPYIARDNRRRIVLYDGNRRITRQYAKLKMEIKINRRLGYNETVDHKDRNTLNDSYQNLQILSRSKHIAKDAIKVTVKSVHTCVWCNKNILTLSKDQRNGKNKAGPFCSRSCSGSYGAALQNNKILKVKRQIVNKNYYR